MTASYLASCKYINIPKYRQRATRLRSVTTYFFVLICKSSPRTAGCHREMTAAYYAWVCTSHKSGFTDAPSLQETCTSYPYCYHISLLFQSPAPSFPQSYALLQIRCICVVSRKTDLPIVICMIIAE